MKQTLQDQTLTLVNKIKQKNLITEKEINLIKNRMNNNKCKPYLLYGDCEILLTPEQMQKGKIWLIKHNFKKNGDLRKTSFLGAREVKAVKTLQQIQFSGFYEHRNQFSTYYYPVYTVLGEVYSFDYYLFGGEMQIIA